MESDYLIRPLKETDRYSAFYKALSPQSPYKVTGLNAGAKALWFSPLLAEPSLTSVLIVAASKEEEDMFSSFFDYLGFKDYEIYPTLEISPNEPIITDINLLDKQYRVIEKLLNRQVKCIITKTRALNQKLMSIQDLKENLLTLRKDQELSPRDLTEELVRLGYKPSPALEKRGEFSRKGGSLNIFPVGFENPVKIGWFDDEIEFIREYDIESGKTRDEIPLVTLYPAGKLIIPKKLPENVPEKIMQELMAQIVRVYSKGLTKHAEELRKKVEGSITNLRNFQYDELTYSYFNYLYKDGASLLDYLPPGSAVIWSEFTSQNNALKKFEETLEPSLKDKYEKGLLLEIPGQLYIPLNDILKKARNFSQLRCSALNDMPNVNLQFNGTMLPAFAGKFDELINTVKKWSGQENKKVLVVTVQPQRALTLLREKDCDVIYGEEPNLETEKGNIWVLKGELSRGFAYPDLNLVIITDSELFGWTQRPLKKKQKEKKDQGIRINKVQDIKTDDYVVHELHGIGQYKGLRTVELEGRKREYFEIIYSKNDKLLVPIEQINLLSLYRGANDVPPRLSRMGGAEWENLKERVKDSVKSIAADLIDLYAKRVHSKGFGFPPDTEWQGQMEDAFPYEETPDQLQAIIDTKADMEKPKPMDRLVCGDVGFGKTEVAIRAAFKAVMSGKQVAVIAPTTVLSQQLYDVIHQRFAPYPIKVAILNRFRSTKESKQIYEDIKKGNLDIVVSTHRVLLKTPEFYDLGLVIIDEEHKFGVAHKERLKQFKTTVDVLTMSATPIPRTLYMALSGARDLSLIETAPRNRFPIETKLSVHSKELIRNGILHELERGGQVYFVHNRVESLGRVHKELQELLPDIRIGIGHGQLPEHELENVMLSFNSREYDVLLCTTIIESGLDIPSANTIIIDNVHMLGLAQLYQLRGRVGRTDIQAYAYFLYPENLKLTDEARQRLQVIQDMSELGTGYQIALRDMEIRGVGDLLGSEQHGNVLSVGYDTYCQILEETVNELKPEDERTSSFAPTVVIDINLPCYIPDSWLDDYRVKMQIYRRLAVVQDIDLLEDMRKELKNSYGELPTVADNLFKVVKIRILAAKLGITSIKSMNKLITVKLKIPEITWRNLVNQYSDLMRWQWSLDEITSRASASPEADINILDKFLNIMLNAFKKEEEAVPV